MFYLCIYWFYVLLLGGVYKDLRGFSLKTAIFIVITNAQLVWSGLTLLFSNWSFIYFPVQPKNYS